MPGLIDPKDHVLAKAECMSGGVALHLTKDCSNDRTCPVWDAWHPRASRDELTDALLSTLTEVVWGNGADTLDEARSFIDANADVLGERAERFAELCEAIETLTGHLDD